MQDSLQRIYKLKVTLLAIVTAVLGLALLFLAKSAQANERLTWLRDLPVFELGSTLFISGAFVVAYNYVDGRDKDARDDERLRRLLADSAPSLPGRGCPGLCGGERNLTLAAVLGTEPLGLLRSETAPVGAVRICGLCHCGEASQPQASRSRTRQPSEVSVRR